MKKDLYDEKFIVGGDFLNSVISDVYKRMIKYEKMEEPSFTWNERISFIENFLKRALKRKTYYSIKKYEAKDE